MWWNVAIVARTARESSSGPCADLVAGSACWPLVAIDPWIGHDTGMDATSSSVCENLPPLVAFGYDFPEPDSDPEDATVQGWLLAAMCFSRIAQMEETERPAGFGSAAEMLATTAATDSMALGANGHSLAAAPARQSMSLAGLLSSAASAYDSSSEWAPHLTRTVHGGAEYLECKGAFHLAYSLLAAFRAAIVPLSMREVGYTIALQGRLARQLGAMQTADDHYRLSERMGRRVREPDLYVRALIGRGVLAATRGNYPEARTLFHRGLQAARRAGLVEHEAAAHSSLLKAAVAARDLDSALTHGWCAFTCCAQLPDRRAEILINLAEVALLAGHPESALPACVEALTLTTVDRVLLAGYGTGAIAASRLRRRDVLDMMASESLSIIQRSRQQLDKAYTLLELAEAYAALAAPEEAGDFLARALRIAEPAGLFEILHRADIVAQTLAGLRSRANAGATVRPDAPVMTHTASHESRDSSDISLSRASRHVIQSLAELRS